MERCTWELMCFCDKLEGVGFVKDGTKALESRTVGKVREIFKGFTELVKAGGLQS